ncbi:MAG: hypothetical protein L6R19_20740 [Alphaproteobacteria bacterium]|nr:hypothetical protein [Alphaproteobacteria bacterium]
MSEIIILPERVRPLPTAADLDRLMQCRYATLIITGRSGSSLIHACLDDHRQIAQIPSIWKFHDFLAANFDVLGASSGEVARAFIEFPAHDMLFDTRCPGSLAARLGKSGDVTILVGRGAFQHAMANALDGCPADPRRILYAAVLAYEWCRGRDTTDVRVVLHHLHHGDWLWPDLLIDRFNLFGLNPPHALQIGLRPDLLLVSLRSPHAILRSYPAIAVGVNPSGADQVKFHERLLRLLAQDWLRTRVAAASDMTAVGIRLEDLKADRRGTLGQLCRLLGVDADDPALDQETLYGYPWHEEAWTIARRRAIFENPGLDRDMFWQDELFAMGCLGTLAAEVYPEETMHRDRNDLLQNLIQAAAEPPPTLFPDHKTTVEARVPAMQMALQRVTFMNQFWSIVDAHSLGFIRLCRASHAEPRRVAEHGSSSNTQSQAGIGAT